MLIFFFTNCTQRSKSITFLVWHQKLINPPKKHKHKHYKVSKKDDSGPTSFDTVPFKALGHEIFNVCSFRHFIPQSLLNFKKFSILAEFAKVFANIWWFCTAMISAESKSALSWWAPSHQIFLNFANRFTIVGVWYKKKQEISSRCKCYNKKHTPVFMFIFPIYDKLQINKTK